MGFYRFITSENKYLNFPILGYIYKTIDGIIFYYSGNFNSCINFYASLLFT